MLFGSRVHHRAIPDVCCGFIIITVPSRQIDSPITTLSCFRYFDWLENEVKQQKALSKQ